METRYDSFHHKPHPGKAPPDKAPPGKDEPKKKRKLAPGTRCEYCNQYRLRCDTETPCHNCIARNRECIRPGPGTPKKNVLTRQRRNCEECSRARMACDDCFPCSTCVRRKKVCVRPEGWTPMAPIDPLAAKDNGPGKKVTEKEVKEQQEQGKQDEQQEQEDVEMQGEPGQEAEDNSQQILPRAVILKGPCSRCVCSNNLCDFEPGQPCPPCAAKNITADDCRSQKPCQRCRAEGFPCDLLSPCLARSAVGRSSEQCRNSNPGSPSQVHHQVPPQLLWPAIDGPAVPGASPPDLSILAPEVPNPRNLLQANLYPLDQASYHDGCHELRGLGQCNRLPHNSCEHTGHAEDFHSWDVCYTCQTETRTALEDVEAQLLAYRKMYFCGLCAGREFADVASGLSQNGSNVDFCLCQAKMKCTWLCKHHRHELDTIINQRVMRTRAYLTSSGGVTMCPRCSENEQEDVSGVSSCGSCHEIIFDEPV